LPVGFSLTQRRRRQDLLLGPAGQLRHPRSRALPEFSKIGTDNDRHPGAAGPISEDLLGDRCRATATDLLAASGFEPT